MQMGDVILSLLVSPRISFCSFLTKSLCCWELAQAAGFSWVEACKLACSREGVCSRVVTREPHAVALLYILLGNRSAKQVFHVWHSIRSIWEMCALSCSGGPCSGLSSRGSGTASRKHSIMDRLSKAYVSFIQEKTVNFRLQSTF